MPHILLPIRSGLKISTKFFFFQNGKNFMQTIFIILSHGSKIVFCTFYETFFPLKKCFFKFLRNVSQRFWLWKPFWKKIDLCCNERLWRASPEFHNHHHQSDFEILFCSCQSVAASRENAAEAEALLRNLSDWTFALQPCTLTCKIILGKNFVHKIIDYLKVVVVFVKKYHMAW